MQHETHVIVGGGLAGAKAAETLRQEGFEGRVVIIGEEPERPYERPPLSKEYLRGVRARDDVFVHKPGFYVEHGIEVRTSSRVEELALEHREVVLSSGERLGFDRLLLATGSAARRLDVPGVELDGVHHLRTLADADALASVGQAGGRVVVVGAGWIGSEVAASLTQAGCEVVVVEPGGVPLERVLGAEVGALYRDLHLAHGVQFVMGTTLESIRGTGRVEAVVTRDGQTIACDVVVAGIGAVPRVELAERAGLPIEGGVVVDEHLETPAPGVFAAGDIAAAWHPLYERRVRVEHWANALNQGIAAASNMLGAREPYDRIPYFYSDQYELGMEYTGYAPAWDRVVFRGRPEDLEFLAFWVRDDRVVAGMNANVWDVIDDIRELVCSRVPVDDACLRDPAVPISELTAGVCPGW